MINFNVKSGVSGVRSLFSKTFLYAYIEFPKKDSFLPLMPLPKKQTNKTYFYSTQIGRVGDVA